jgi:hypothetical protein
METSRGRDFGIAQPKSTEFIERKEEVTQRIFDLFRYGKIPSQIKIDNLPGILGIEEQKPVEQKEKESDSDFKKRKQEARNKFNIKLRAELIKLFPNNKSYNDILDYLYSVYQESSTK